MGQFSVISSRRLKNKAGQETGRLKVLVRTGSTTAETSYKCPECLNEGQINLEWQRPFVVACQKCSGKMKMEKLKKEMKKEKDAEKKQKEAELIKFRV